MDNHVRLQLFALAYNLGNVLKRLALPKSVKRWSLTTLREKHIRIGTEAVRHSRYGLSRRAEVTLPGYRILGKLVSLGTFLAAVWAGLMARSVEIGLPIVVLW